MFVRTTEVRPCQWDSDPRSGPGVEGYGLVEVTDGGGKLAFSQHSQAALEVCLRKLQSGTFGFAFVLGLQELRKFVDGI